MYTESTPGAGGTGTCAPNKAEAERFLTLLDEGASCFAFQTFDDNKDRKDRRLARVLYGTFDECWPELCRLSTEGAGVFVTVNETDGRGRKSENIIRVRAVFHDMDAPGAHLPRLTPHGIVETSPGKSHRYWLVDDADRCFGLFAGVMATMVEVHGSDPNAKDLARVLRLPGFPHQKDPAHPWMVRIAEEGSFQPYTWGEITAAIPPKVAEQKKGERSDGEGLDNLGKIKSALDALDPDEGGYSAWLEIGMALHHASGGSNAGLALWDEWSQRGAKYKAQEMQAKWTSFDGHAGNKVTLGTLFKRASAKGWHWAWPDDSLPIQRGEEAPDLLLSAKGGLLPLVHNVLVVLREAPEWEGVLAYDQFSERAMLLRRPPYAHREPAWVAQPLRDSDDVETAAYLQHKHSLHVPSHMASEGLQTVACGHGFHPVRAYLDSLVWDGTPRLDAWLTTYFGVVESEYTSAVGSKALIAAVARIYRPGCKADAMLILEGPQGLYKSTAWRVLAGDEWFTDSMPDLHSKDAMEQLRGKWIIEMAELASFGRSAVEAVKRCLSTTHDHYRPAYGRRAVDLPRQCIFVGTTNEQQYLKDATGNRRYWPVSVTQRCSIKALRKARDQLWAEAVHRFRGGALWYLSTEMDQKAAEQQMARTETDDWEGPIMAYLELQKTPFTTTRELMERALGIEDCLYWTQAHSRRVGAIFRKHGWIYGNYRMGEDGKQMKGFLRPLVTTGTTSNTHGNTSGNTKKSNDFNNCTTATTATPLHNTKKKEDASNAYIHFPISYGDTGNSGNIGNIVDSKGENLLPKSVFAPAATTSSEEGVVPTDETPVPPDEKTEAPDDPDASRKKFVEDGFALVVNQDDPKNAHLLIWAEKEGRLVYIDRSHGGEWSNPLPPPQNSGGSERRLLAYTRYAEHMRSRPELLGKIATLEGKILACRCAPKLCHGDFLAKCVNASKREELAQRHKQRADTGDSNGAT